MRGAFEGLALRTMNAAQLLHEMKLRGQAPGRVHDHDVDAAGLARVDGVEGHGGGVAPFLRDHVDAVSLAPDGELFARGGAEGVARGQEHGLALGGEEFRQFPDGRGLSGAVDARHHHDERRGTLHVEGDFRGGENRFDLIPKGAADLFLRAQSLQFNFVAQTL